MRMYKREEEVDGMVCDPLKALHQVSISSISIFIFSLFKLEKLGVSVKLSSSQHREPKLICFYCPLDDTKFFYTSTYICLHVFRLILLQMAWLGIFP